MGTIVSKVFYYLCNKIPGYLPGGVFIVQLSVIVVII
jgi:hypothetical protein